AGWERRYVPIERTQVRSDGPRRQGDREDDELAGLNRPRRGSDTNRCLAGERCRRAGERDKRVHFSPIMTRERLFWPEASAARGSATTTPAARTVSSGTRRI